MKLYDRCCSCPTTIVRAKRLNATFKHVLCTCRFMFVLKANVNVAVNTICRFAQTSIVIKVIVPRGNRITALAGLRSYEIGKIATLQAMGDDYMVSICQIWDLSNICGKFTFVYCSQMTTRQFLCEKLVSVVVQIRKSRAFPSALFTTTNHSLRIPSLLFDVQGDDVLLLLWPNK